MSGLSLSRAASASPVFPPPTMMTLVANAKRCYSLSNRSADRDGETRVQTHSYCVVKADEIASDATALAASNAALAERPRPAKSKAETTRFERFNMVERVTSLEEREGVSL